MGEDDKPVKIGAMRGFGWLVAAAWWLGKSKASPRPLALAAIPWALCVLLIRPTGGISIVVCLAWYASMSSWSASWAAAHFASQEARTKQGGPPSRASRSLLIIFTACCIASMLWAHAWTQASGMVDMLGEMAEAASGSAAGPVFWAYWSKSGLDGVAWAIGAQQAELALANAWWCLMPFAALARPHSSIKDLATFGARALARAPLALATLGASGALLAQASLVFPPLALLAGLWFSACAFAFRDLRDLLAPDFP